jgi:hypothetical protein
MRAGRRIHSGEQADGPAPDPKIDLQIAKAAIAGLVQGAWPSCAGHRGWRCSPPTWPVGDNRARSSAARTAGSTTWSRSRTQAAPVSKPMPSGRRRGGGAGADTTWPGPSGHHRWGPTAGRLHTTGRAGVTASGSTPPGGPQPARTRSYGPHWGPGRCGRTRRRCGTPRGCRRRPDPSPQSPADHPAARTGR